MTDERVSYFTGTDSGKPKAQYKCKTNSNLNMEELAARGLFTHNIKP
jgi:hypothetical protein